MSEATKPAVSARSTTCGTHNNEASSQSNNAPHTKRSVNVQRVFAQGNSTTANNAQAAIIQLTNKGITAVDGLLANGLSQGKATHNTKMMLRTQRLWSVDEFMQRFSTTAASQKQRRP
jgi:hypothetical protein